MLKKWLTFERSFGFLEDDGTVLLRVLLQQFADTVHIFLTYISEFILEGNKMGANEYTVKGLE